MLLNLIYHVGSKQTDPYIESVFDRFRRSFSTKINQSVFWKLKTDWSYTSLEPLLEPGKVKTIPWGWIKSNRICWNYRQTEKNLEWWRGGKLRKILRSVPQEFSKGKQLLWNGYAHDVYPESSFCFLRWRIANQPETSISRMKVIRTISLCSR